jgi:hypothetical protein
MSEPAPSPDPFGDDDDLDRPSEPRSSTPTGRRAGSRVVLGFVLGPVLGAVLGLVIGLLAFGAGSRGMWAALIAGAVFGALGGFWGGLSALGPVEPENDPLPRAGDDDASRGGSTTVG